MWGAGDAAAAVVGIPFGKHKVKSRLTDGKKSWEGSAAMLIISFAVGTVVLLRAHEAGPLRACLLASAAALVGTSVELVSPSECDTVTVPVSIVAVLLLLRAAL